MIEKTKIPRETIYYIQEKMNEYFRRGNHSWPRESSEWIIKLFLEWQSKNPCWDCNSNLVDIKCPKIKEGCPIKDYRERHIC